MSRPTTMVCLLALACASASAAPPGRTTTYVFGGNGARGRYDCSGYLNELLAVRAPGAYAAVTRLRARPRAREYLDAMLVPVEGWIRVERVRDLRAGDVLAWTHRAHRRSTGHVMLVVGEPRRDPRFPSAYQLRVEDAAESPHSDDTRPPGVSGVGRGTILLHTDEHGEPVRFAWTLDGRWQSPAAIAMGRPRR